MAKTEQIKMSLLETNNGQIAGLPKNPRFIRDGRFGKLKESIKENPEMLGNFKEYTQNVRKWNIRIKNLLNC